MKPRILRRFLMSRRFYLVCSFVLILFLFENCEGGFKISLPAGGASAPAISPAASSSSTSSNSATSGPVPNGAGGTSAPVGTVAPVGTPNVGGATSAKNTMRPIGSPFKGNGYWEYLPVGYGGTAKSPLMVFFHGIGENGTGDTSSLPMLNSNKGSIPELIADSLWPSTRPFVVLSPQHAGSDCPSPTEIFNFIQFAVGNYNVDPTRVYATGLSCGALGLSSYFGQYGNSQVAATVLVAGDATDEWNGQGCALVKNVAVWAFHGDADSAVSINGDNTYMPQFQACAPLKNAGLKSVQYTVLPGDDHQQTWIDTYNMSAGDIYSWLLQFNRSNN